MQHAAAGAKAPSSSDVSGLRLVLPRRPATGLAVEADVAEGLPEKDSSAATGAQGLVAEAGLQRQAGPPLQKWAAVGASHQSPVVPQAAPCTGAALKVVPAAEGSLPSAADLLQSLDAMLASRGKRKSTPRRGPPGPSKVRTLGATDHYSSTACAYRTSRHCPDKTFCFAGAHCLFSIDPPSPPFTMKSLFHSIAAKCFVYRSKAATSPQAI